MSDKTQVTGTSVLPHRWAMLVALVLMTALAAVGILHGPLFGEEGPVADGIHERGIVEDLMAKFGYDSGDILLVLQGDDLFRPDAVAATRRLIADLELIGGVGRVLSLDSLPPSATQIGSPILPADGASPGAFHAARVLALSHPLIRGYLSDEEGQTWLLPLQINEEHFDAEGSQPVEDFVAELRRTTGDANLPEDMRVLLTGSIMLTDASARAFEREQWLFHSIAYVLVFLLATILFRGVWAVLLSGGGPLIGVFWTFGIAKLFGLYLSSLTLILLPVMLMMIGFTDSVHLMVHIRKERTRGLSPAEATSSSLRLLALPCVLTSLTTGLGFASLLVARSQLVRDFGVACAVGVLCTLVAVLSFLPFCSSSFLGRYLQERKSSRLVDGSLPLVGRMLAWNARHARLITVVGCLLAVGALIHGAPIETENRMRADIPSSSDAARALLIIDEEFGGSMPAMIAVRWDEAVDGDWERITQVVGAVEAIVASGNEHSRPLALPDVLDFLAPNGNVATGMALLQLLPSWLTDRFLHRESRTALVSFALPDLGSRHFRDTFRGWGEGLQGLEDRYPEFEFDLGGQAILSGQIYETFTRDLMNSLALAAIIIFVVLTVAFRSLRLGLISIVPNVLPLAATASLLVALDMPMAGATAFVMSLGIAVDDTIHFLTRYRHELRQGHTLEVAIERSVVGVGKALVMTTVVLVVGFASVLTSDFPRNRVFAGMICISLVAALASDLFLLPAMLKTLGPRRRAQDAQ